MVLHHLRKSADIQSDEMSDPFAEDGMDSEYTPYLNQLVSQFQYKLHNI